MDMSKLGEAGIKANLESYLQGFSKRCSGDFWNAKFSEFLGQANDANLLYKVVQQVRLEQDLDYRCRFATAFWTGV